MALLRRGHSWSGNERNCAFLNCGGGPASTGGQTFANISAVSGLDFPDDGRGLAMVDWDHDGDLDVWLRNRTGPRLRLMLNGSQTPDQPAAHAFVAFQLRGTTCNRDAIGARVEVVIKAAKAAEGDPQANIANQHSTLIQTLYAGDGYVSQSSKWLHFGLGVRPTVEGVVVRWPGGRAETFAEIEPNRHYILEQGRGSARPWARPSSGASGIKLRPARQESPTATDAARVFFSRRVPLPTLPYTTPRDEPEQVFVDTRSAGLLVNFWASWCGPCKAELREFAEHRDELRKAGLDVLALSVDGLETGGSTRSVDTASLLRQLDFPFRSGAATTRLLDKLEIVQEMLFTRRHPFVVPFSLLLDRNGDLAAIYRGRIGVRVLLRDVANLDESPARWLELSTPLPGRWVRSPTGLSPRSIAKWFNEPYPEDAVPFFVLSIELQEARLGSTAVAADARQHEERQLAETRYQLAQALRELGRLDEAITAYLRVVRALPDFPEAHYRLATALVTRSRLEEAVVHFRRSLELTPDWVEPLNNLAWLLAASGNAELRDGAEAVRHAERAAELTGHENPIVLDTLSAAYAEAGRFDDAITAAGKALELDTALERQETADGIREHLDLYRQGRPVRDP